MMIIWNIACIFGFPLHIFQIFCLFFLLACRKLYWQLLDSFVDSSLCLSFTSLVCLVWFGICWQLCLAFQFGLPFLPIWIYAACLPILTMQFGLKLCSLVFCLNDLYACKIIFLYSLWTKERVFLWFAKRVRKIWWKSKQSDSGQPPLMMNFFD